jgi:DNA-binding response OmpR family regulator
LSVETPSPDSIHVLVVDDDDEIRTLIEDLLTDEGISVETASDGPSAVAALKMTTPDVILLDMVMPAMNGLELLAQVRAIADVPVIFVTGRGGETDRVLGLRMGADDYVVKPFSGPELVARVYSVLRRSRASAPAGPVAEDTMRFGRLVIDPASRDVMLDDKVVETTAKEFDLLAFLAGSPKRVFSREQVLEHVWDSRTEWQDPATVTEHIRRLRRKIEDDPDNPQWLRTVRGVGYRFEG